MSSDTMLQIASNDTPAFVQVPPTLYGLIVRAVGRLGGGILVAIACTWALSKMHDDHAKKTERMMPLLETRTDADSQFATAIFSVKTGIKQSIELPPPILN